VTPFACPNCNLLVTPESDHPPHPCGALVVDSFTVQPPVTRCKHGRGACEECGTSDRRDALHRTKGGRGAVARLRR
jgi:hypothetical protein